MVDKDKSDKKSNGSPVMAAVKGAIVGGVAVAAAMTLSDEKNRKKIKDAISNVKDKSMEYVEDVKQSVQDKKDEIADTIEDKKEDIADKAEKIKKVIAK